MAQTGEPLPSKILELSMSKVWLPGYVSSVNSLQMESLHAV